MARVKRAVHARKGHKEVLELARGYYGHRSRNYRAANEAVRAMVKTAKAEAAARDAARKSRDWPEADRLRDELAALSVEVMDGPAGATWRFKGQA